MESLMDFVTLMHSLKVYRFDKDIETIYNCGHDLTKYEYYNSIL